MGPKPKLTRKQIYEAKTLAQLEVLAASVGHSKGWALRIHNARLTKQKGTK